MKIKIVSNVHTWGGGEMSIVTIMKMLVARGHEVRLHPTMDRILEQVLAVEGISIGDKLADIDDLDCDVLFFYANTWAYHVHEQEELWKKLCASARRRVMCLNFVIGGAKAEWFRGLWDLVVFLNKEKASHWDYTETDVLAPCVDLEPFLKVQPDYSSLKLIRCSRSKHCEDEVAIALEVADLRPDVQQWYMTAPPQLNGGPQIHKFGASEIPVPEFLSNGSLFWYRLKPGYQDQGPRVIVEAMAAGLPCVVDNRDSAKDRVTHETGWKCETNQEYLDVIEFCHQYPKSLEHKGRLARQRAIEHFDPEKWMERILG